MSFNFLHRPSRKREHNPWYESALLLALAGSIIAVVGQLAGTVIPIMYGSQDASDFTISINPISSDIISDRPGYAYSPYSPYIIDVTAEDFNPVLRHYRFKIYLHALNAPEGVDVEFNPPEITAGNTSKMSISAANISGKFEIVIQGVGADGKMRNATFYGYARFLGKPPFRPTGYVQGPGAKSL